MDDAAGTPRRRGFSSRDASPTECLSARQLRQEIIDRHGFDTIDSLTALAEEYDNAPGQFAGALGKRIEPFQIARVDVTRGFDFDGPELSTDR